MMPFVETLDPLTKRRPPHQATTPLNDSAALRKHMKRITLPELLDSLLNMTEEVVIAPAVAAKARHAVERMIHLKS